MRAAPGDTGAVYINDKFFGYVDELNNPGGGLLLNEFARKSLGPQRRLEIDALWLTAMQISETPRVPAE